MKKVLIFFLLSLFLLTGCENKEEDSKNQYLSLKNKIMEKEDYTKIENLPIDITTKIDRQDEEKVRYKVVLDNPKENMKNMKVIVVHNYYTENLFPTIGIFDKTKELSTNTEKNKVELEDVIETTKNLSDISLELKVWVEYTNDLGETKDFLYKTT